MFCVEYLSLLPNLKVLKAENKWLITKMARNNDQIPFGRCQVRALSFADPDQQPAIWTVLAELSAITHYGFQDWLLNCTLGLDSPWRPLVNVDLSGLKLLRLYFKASLEDSPHDLPGDTNLSAMLQHLHDLEVFILDQFFRGGWRTTPSMLPSATNVLGQLKAKKWPRLRHLDMRFLTTTVADFQAFVAPHTGTLKTFRLYGMYTHNCWRVRRSREIASYTGSELEYVLRKVEQNSDISYGSWMSGL